MPRLLDRWLPWLAAAVLAAGVAAFAVARATGGSPAAPATAPVPLAPAAREVAQRFVDTAVARRRLGESYDLVAPDLRQGLSRAEWRTGTIPVVPYPVARARERWRVVRSVADEAALAVTFVPKPGAAVAGGAFTLELVRDGGRWLVSSWQPSGGPVAPGK